MNKNQEKESSDIMGRLHDGTTVETQYVHDIPVAICIPDKSRARNRLAVWLPFLGGDKQMVFGDLQKLAALGFHAISLDPWLHGDRKVKGAEDVRAQVPKGFRAVLWPILGITTLNVFSVIDWAIQTYSLENSVVAGGLSMGGDIAIALAGIDSRITKIAAIASSPDWDRPGMRDVMDASKTIEQGMPTPLGKWFYGQLNPMVNKDHYSNKPLMHLEFGSLDAHIHAVWAVAFKEALGKDCPETAQSINIVENQGYDHITLVQDQVVIDKAIRFLGSGGS